MPINDHLFRTQPNRSPETLRVDRQAKVIRGAKVIQLGAVNDSRPWDVDEETLAQVADHIGRPNKGLKARFTHPGLSDDGLGKYLGRWRNPRIEGDAVFADLHIAEVAFDSPSGDLGNYVMNLAEEDPEAFGVSVATKLDESMFSETEERLPLRIAGLHAADFVDTPAATRGGLFEAHSQDGIPAVATWILENHFKGAEPEEVLQRVEGFLSRHYGRGLSMEKDPDVSGQITPQVSPETSGDLSREAAAQYLELFGDAGARWYLEGKKLEECFTLTLEGLKSENVELRSQVEDLSARLDAALKASGEIDPLSVEPKVHVDPALSAKREKAEKLKAQGYQDRTARWAASFTKVD